MGSSINKERINEIEELSIETSKIGEFPVKAQRVKDPALSLLLLQFNTWPGNFCKSRPKKPHKIPKRSYQECCKPQEYWVSSTFHFALDLIFYHQQGWNFALALHGSKTGHIWKSYNLIERHGEYQIKFPDFKIT